MDLSVVRAARFGDVISTAIEQNHRGVTVYSSSMTGVPEDMEIAAAGGLHLTIEGETWSRVSTVRDAVQDGFDEMGLAWEHDDELTHHAADDAPECCQIAMATELLTPAHIDRSPWPPTSLRAASMVYGKRNGEGQSLPSAEPTTFPLETMTESQRTAFRQFLRARREEWIGLNEPIWLALVLACERPATLLTSVGVYPPVRDNISVTVADVAAAFDLDYYWWSETCLTVARSSWRLDLLPTPSEFSDAYHRRMGCFFGFPEADIDYFLTGTKGRTKPYDYVEEEVFQPEEVAYVTFVPQVHEDSIAGYERAIAAGKENRDTITDFAEMWELPALEVYAEWMYHEALTDCVLHV